MQWAIFTSTYYVHLFTGEVWTAQIFQYFVEEMKRCGIEWYDKADEERFMENMGQDANILQMVYEDGWKIYYPVEETQTFDLRFVDWGFLQDVVKWCK